MPEKKFLKKVIEKLKTCALSKIKYMYTNKGSSVVLGAVSNNKLLIEGNPISFLKELKSHIEDSLVPIFIAKCFHIPIEMVYADVYSAYEKQLKETLNLLNEEGLKSLQFNIAGIEKPTIYVDLLVVATNSKTSSIKDIFNFERNHICHKCVEKASFEVKLYVGNDEFKIYDIVNREYLTE